MTPHIQEFVKTSGIDHQCVHAANYTLDDRNAAGPQGNDSGCRWLRRSCRGRELLFNYIENAGHPCFGRELAGCFNLFYIAVALDCTQIVGKACGHFSGHGGRDQVIDGRPTFSSLALVVRRVVASAFEAVLGNAFGEPLAKHTGDPKELVHLLRIDAQARLHPNVFSKDGEVLGNIFDAAEFNCYWVHEVAKVDEEPKVWREQCWRSR